MNYIAFAKYPFDFFFKHMGMNPKMSTGLGGKSSLFQGGQKLKMEYGHEQSWEASATGYDPNRYLNWDKSEKQLNSHTIKTSKIVGPQLLGHNGGARGTNGKDITGALMKCVCSDKEAGYMHKGIRVD